MNATIERFGWPTTEVADYAHWVVLLRPAAVTLGSLVLAAKGEATSYAALPAAAFTEQGAVIADIERSLARWVSPDRINYLMLMMVDPHVHFHVIPRYNGERSFDGTSFPDHGWPKLPDLGRALELEESARSAHVSALRSLWFEGA